MKRWIGLAMLLAWCIPSPVPAQKGNATDARSGRPAKVQVVVTPLPEVLETVVFDNQEETHEALAEDLVIRTASENFPKR